NNDLAVVPLTQAKKIPFISTAAADQIVHAGGTLDGAVLSNVFQTPPSAARVGERLLQYMRDQGLAKMAIAHDSQSAFADSGTSAMKSTAGKYGITFVADETFETSQTQYQTMMAHIRASGAQGIMVWGTGTPPPLITHAWAAAGLKIPLMFSHASASTQFVKAVGQDGEGVIVGTSVATIGQSLPDSFPSKKEITAMATTFQQKNGYYPPEFAFNAYAAVKLLSQGIKNANSVQPKKIDDALNSLSLNTAGGNFRYSKTDHYGIGIDWAAVAVIKGAQLVPTDFSLKTLQSGK
ncbi:MAG: ABC transporter substrate-binding protein, partial [Candidatus Dormibacteraeota bacterium]|nr:ABC transporter substrate-binding protein [Candidatus Dormibacteraeota bacterium]